MGFLTKNVFGEYNFKKRWIIRIFGILIYPRYKWINDTVITGAEQLNGLPDKNVLFVSNHQTYFGDVAAFLLTFHSALGGNPNKLNLWSILRPKKDNIFYVAAEETMKSGLLPKILAVSGAVTVKRTWRANGENVRRKVDRSEVDNIDKALLGGWVITFPQGTTRPFVKGRVGTAFIIKKHKPIVIPIVIDGLRSSFDKKGLLLKKKGSTITVRIKKPIDIDYEGTVESMLEQVMDGIEQTSEFDFMGSLKSNTN